jgi:sec-independent protein translocase protein TatB
MFDIAFSELLLIGIVALVIIGPERLPKIARTAGSWLGKLNRYVAQVKQDIDRDMQLEELRKLQSEMKASAQKYELMAEETSQKIQKESTELNKVMQAMAATDGGLTLREYEKIKADAASEDALAESPETIAPAGAAPTDGAVADGTAAEVAETSASPGANQPDPAPASPSANDPAAPYTSDLFEEIRADDMTPADPARKPA